MTEIDEILNRVVTTKDKILMLTLSAHRPIIKHGGDQRDPTEEISCTCKKVGFTIHELGMSYYLHLFDILHNG